MVAVSLGFFVWAVSHWSRRLDLLHAGMLSPAKLLRLLIDLLRSS